MQRPDAAELSANAAPDVELSPASDPSAMREEPEAEPEVEEDAPPAPAEADTTMVRRRWGEVLEAIGRIRRTTWALVARSATVGEIRGGALYLIFETQGLVGAFRAGNHAEHVSTALRETLGVDVRIEPVTSDDLPSGGVSSGGASGSSGPGGSASGDAGSPGRAGGPGRSASGQDSGGIPVPEEPPFDPTAEVPQEHSELSEPTSTPAPGEKAEPPQRANAERAATSRPAPAPEPAAHARGLQSGARVSPSSADGSGATDSPGGLGAIDEEDLPSPDDQDVVEAGLVGGPVIERVLGGRRVNESGR